MTNIMDEKKITREQIHEALQMSGYLLEQRICPILTRHKYKVITNIPYEDFDSGESRELDVDAERIVFVRHRKNEFPEHFDVELLIACKNNHWPVVGITRKATCFDQYDLGISCSGVPSFVDGTPIEFALVGKHHHYSQHKYIAIQTCNIEPKKVDKDFKYVANNRQLYGTIYGLCKAVRSKEKEYIKNQIEPTAEAYSTLSKENIGELPLFFKIIYPVILFGGDLYEYRTEKSRHSLKEVNHILLFHSISSRNLKGAYLIDLIREKYLSKYIDVIKENNNEMCRFLRKNMKDARKTAYKDVIRIREQLMRNRIHDST